jgi:hypothetical protein
MSDVLGLDHPLTRASAALDATVRQLLVVGAIFAGSLAATAQHASWARSVSIASAVVLLGFAAAAVIRTQTRRDLVLELIVEGRERLPLSVVQRERRRLERPRTRRILARTLELLIEETLQRRKTVGLSSRPLLHPRLAADVRAEIRALAELLRSGEVTVRGVAFCERLLTDGGSPLYGQDPIALRGELHRARALLGLA